MSAFSDALELNIIRHFLKATTAVAQPAGLYLALFDTDPGDAGSSGTEITGTGYSRQTIAFSNANPTSNTEAISLTNSSGSAWTVGGWGIYDASTSGTLLFHGALSASKTVNNTDTINFAIGAIQITLD